MEKKKSLAIWKGRKLFLYDFYKKKKKKIQSFKSKLLLLKVLLFLSWVAMITASFGLVLPSVGSLAG